MISKWPNPGNKSWSGPHWDKVGNMVSGHRDYIGTKPWDNVGFWKKIPTLSNDLGTTW